jgi:putative phosphoribosyl transferase
MLLPERARGAVVFAHGSGSSHRSPRNLQVARALAGHGLLALLFDLLTEEEAQDRRLVFNIPLLARRLLLATDWLREKLGPKGELDRHGAELPIGYFGASTGAAAAIWAATEPDNDITAIVSRGGRPDLAEVRLDAFQVPTLLIVGGDDQPVLELTRPLLAKVPRSELVVIPGATHLFEEPGALEAVAEHAARWFTLCFDDETARRSVA